MEGRGRMNLSPLVPLVDDKVYANTLQCTHSPSRILLFFPRIQLAEEVLHELGISVLQDGFSNESHQVQLIVYVVHRQEMCSGCFLCSDVIDVRPGDA
jgi:hypothetical protein